MSVKITGFKKIRIALDRHRRRTQIATLAGMHLATKFVQGESQEETPHEFGLLVGDAFSDAETRGEDVVGRVGYTRDYAAFVHEMPASNNFTKPGTGPNFLRGPALRNARKIMRIIRSAAQWR
jgi:hypothetical protein